MKTHILFPHMLLGALLTLTLTAQAASTIQFAATTFKVAEGSETAALLVLRTEDTNTTAGVDYAMADITATNGVKYSASSGSLTFAPTETRKSIVVPILNESSIEGTKTFRVFLRTPAEGAVLGTRTNVVVSILDNDLGIQFRSSANLVPEAAGSVQISVVRSDDGNFPVTVDLVTANATATSGLDYLSFTNKLSFAAHETIKTVSIPILNDTLKEANETFQVTLSNPTGGGVLGLQKSTTVVIQDNDQGFQFALSGYTVSEDAGAALITVLRGTDQTNATATVDLVTSDLTAIEGKDYSGVTNTLVFAPGQTIQQIAIPILNDGLPEPTEKFRLNLSNPVGGVLGAPITTDITILDNDPGLGFEFESYSVWENAGAVELTILRGNDLNLGPLTVHFDTSDGTAHAGVDYQAVSGIVTFLQNETVKTLSIPILRDVSITNDTSFTVTLNNPTGGATFGVSTSTITILDAPGSGTYRTIAPAADPALTIQRQSGVNLLTWDGKGQLQKADRPTGPWQTVKGAGSPWTIRSEIPATYYRIRHLRAVNLFIPANYDGQTARPLVILLHGLPGTGADWEDWMRFRPLAEARGFLYCYPDGLGGGWNDGTLRPNNVDDVGYLRGLIEATGAQFALDRKRVYVIGHSNGGFMAYRMACEAANVIAGIASLAGVTPADPSRCQPSQPVNILHIHGSADTVISYPPSVLTGNNDAAGALQSVQIWANYNGAHGFITDSTGSMDLDLSVPGLETVVSRYTNAPPGGAVELWTIEGGDHGPNLFDGSTTSEFAAGVIDWLLAHPKP